ncbi:MAG: ATP-binding protein [Spirochaetes bacterium]|nr:ATP-binding protein [Spirochaetota bacterium]
MKIQNKGELKTLFLQDGKKTLEGIARLFAYMDQKKWNPSLANEVFQSIHSLKSEASFLGYTKVVTDAERMEERLSQFRKSLPTETEWKDFQQLYLTLEADLSTILRGVELELSPAYAPQIDKLRDFEKVLLKEAKVRGEALYRVDAEVEDGESMPYPRLYLLINTLELRANVLRITPSLETLQKEKSKSCSLMITSSAPLVQLQSWVQINGLKRVSIHPLRIEEFLGEAESFSEGQTLSPVFRYRKGAETMLTLSSSFFQRQELVVTCMEDMNDCLRQALLEGIIQQTGVSIDLLIKKAAQLVNDLAPQLSKEVVFHGVDNGNINGDPMKIPYRAFEGLNLILNHLLRNAVDHGIEHPEDRKKAGKSSYGTLRLTFNRKGSIYSIRIQDDGKGIDREEIESKIRDNGMKGKDLLSLLVQGEVSTKSSEVSGRGIGLQTVHSIVENLGASLTMDTTPGKGTLFEVSFDLLSLKHPVFPCSQGTRMFYVPKVLVEDMFPLAIKSIRVVGDRKVYPMRGREFPVKVLNSNLDGTGGIGILLSIWDHQGVLWTESVGEETWIPPITLKKDLLEIVTFLLA